LVTTDAAKPPDLEPAPELLLLPGPPMVKYPNDNDNNDNDDNIGMNN